MEHKSHFPCHFSINCSKINLEDFIKLVLLICQKYKMSSDLKFFETTNDGVHPTGTVFFSSKITKTNKIQSLRKKILSKKLKNQENFMLN